MKYRIISVLFLAASVILMSACQSLKEPELVSLEIVDLNRTAGDGVLKVRLTYSNPNGKSLTIKRIDVDGRINQKSLGTSSLPKRGRIEQKAEEVVEMSFTFDPDEIYPGFLSRQFGAIGSKRVRVSLDGEAEFIKEDKSMIVPLEYSEVYRYRIDEQERETSQANLALEMMEKRRKSS